MIKNLFEKLGKKGVSRADSPLNNLEAAHRWVAQLHGLPQLEAHRRAIALLEEHNQSNNLAFDAQRIHILGLIEHAGSKLQYGLIKHFFEHLADPQHEQAVYWHEIVAFYQLLAETYLNLALRDARQSRPPASLPTMVLRALHYQGKSMQWRYLRFELPEPKHWATLHRLYQIACQHEFAHKNMVLKGSAYATCEGVYARVLMLHLMRPAGLPPNEIELTAYWSWKWRDTISLSSEYNPALHTHFVSLHSDAPPQSCSAHHRGAGPAHVYWSVNMALEQAHQQLSGNGDTQPMQVKLYGVPYTADKSIVMQHILSRLATRAALRPDFSRLIGEIEMQCCDSTIVKQLVDPPSAVRINARSSSAGHPEEPYFRLNIVEDVSGCRLKSNQLILLETTGGHPAELATIRWIEQKGARLVTLGVERLGSHPKLVTFIEIADPAEPCAFNPDSTTGAIGIALSDPGALIVFGLPSQRHLDLREDEFVYRVRMRGIMEQNPQWMLLPIARLTRTRLMEKLAA